MSMNLLPGMEIKRFTGRLFEDCPSYEMFSVNLLGELHLDILAKSVPRADGSFNIRRIAFARSRPTSFRS
jgi:hypothetical protein